MCALLLLLCVSEGMAHKHCLIVFIHVFALVDSIVYICSAPRSELFIWICWAVAAICKISSNILWHSLTDSNETAVQPKYMFSFTFGGRAGIRWKWMRFTCSLEMHLCNNCTVIPCCSINNNRNDAMQEKRITVCVSFDCLMPAACTKQW